MSSLREPASGVTLKDYQCRYCDATTKAYNKPVKCHGCHRVGGLDSYPKAGSVNWLKAHKTENSNGTSSRKWMADQMIEHFSQLNAVREEGQKEYAHDEEDAFANFRRLGKSLGLSKEKVLLVYAQKHMDGIYSYINGHVSQRETVQGRIKDLITYLHLLWGMVDADA